MKNLTRTLTIFALATSMSAFAASKKADEAAKTPEANNTVAEAKAMPCPAAQETTQANPCISCQVQSEDNQEKSDRQKLIEDQEKEWLRNVDYAR